jgi:hypothetical protein
MASQDTTLIYNTNEYLRWDKTECDKYTITNISNYNVNVIVTDVTGTWTETFELEVDGSNTVVVPGDGVFSLCAARLDVPSNVEEVPTTNGFLSVIEFGITQSEVLQTATFYNGSSYVTIDPTDGDFSNIPSSCAAFISGLQTYVNANGGGNVYVVGPGQDIPGVVPAANSYRIVVKANSVWLSSIDYDNGGEPITNDSDLFCNYEYIFTEANQYIFSLSIKGNDVPITGDYWDMSTEAGAQQAEDDINNFLGNDGYAVATVLGLSIYYTNPSPEVACTDVILEAGTLVIGEYQCDYIYEFCDMYACLSRLVTTWLCNEPCKDISCSPDELSIAEARNRAIEMSTLFFHALMPLVSQDRIWYFGNWDITESRTCNINNIKDLFTKLRDYTKHCGFNCEEQCKDNTCIDCGTGYGNPLYFNSSTIKPCGCK